MTTIKYQTDAIYIPARSKFSIDTVLSGLVVGGMTLWLDWTVVPVKISHDFWRKKNHIEHSAGNGKARMCFGCTHYARCLLAQIRHEQLPNRWLKYVVGLLIIVRLENMPRDILSDFYVNGTFWPITNKISNIRINCVVYVVYYNVE